jgi:enterobactin synthetase component D
MELLRTTKVKLVSVPLPFNGKGDLPMSLQDAHPARKDKFLAGRHCARLALGEHAPLETLADGSPEWPTGYVGSITHTEGIAAAAVATVIDHHYLGLDIEPIMSQKIYQNTSHRILVGDELILPFGWDTLVWTTLVFSAKESIYKALRPHCGHFFGFEAAEIYLQNDDGFSFVLKADIGGGFTKGFAGKGRFEIKDRRIWTLVTD